MILAKLVYEGQAVGVRVFMDQGMYDIDMDAVRAINREHSNLIHPGKMPRKVELRSVGSLLLADDEIQSRIHAKDISNDRAALNKVTTWLLNHETAEHVKSASPKNTYKMGSSALNFKSGVAIILLGIDEESAEYKTISTDMNVNLFFTAKTALTKACDLLGYKLDRKTATTEYDGGKRFFRVKLDGMLLYQLKSKFGCKLGIAKDGYALTYQNHYNDTFFSIRLVPPNFDFSYSQIKGVARLGPVADGESLEEYIEGLKTSINDGKYDYYPELSALDMQNRWGRA